MPALEVSGLNVRYGGIHAVRDLGLGVDAGEVLVVLGANGAGKSSSLRAISGLVRSSGRVRWRGQDISRWAAHRRARAGLVLVPEGRRVFSPLTVEDNLLMGAYVQRSRAKQRETMERVYAMFPNLLRRRRSNAGLLSGGEQQMLAIGRALMADPTMILMDEPSMGLAPAVVDLVMDAIAGVAKTGIGVLMVEQNAVAALEVTHRAVVLDRGSVMAEGAADDLREHPALLHAFLGSQAVGGAESARERPDAAAEQTGDDR